MYYSHHLIFVCPLMSDGNNHGLHVVAQSRRVATASSSFDLSSYHCYRLIRVFNVECRHY